MSIRITHPRPELGRKVAFDIEFCDGVATVDELHPVREEALRQHGFTVENAHDGVDLETLDKAALRDIADTEGVEVAQRATKRELIDALNTAAAKG